MFIDDLLLNSKFLASFGKRADGFEFYLVAHLQKQAFS